MKINRRKFFGLGAGAAVAAPVAMKQVASASALPSYRGAHAAMVLGVPGGAEDPENLKRELVGHTKRLAGLSKPKPRHARHYEPIIAEHIDGLRSVSRVNKARMMVDAREVLEVERERTWIQSCIDSIKERLGPLGSFL